MNEKEGEFNFKSKDGVDYPNKESYLFTGIIGGCGCGNSEEISVDVYNLFIKIATETPDKHIAIYKDRYSELIAHIFDAKGLTEHGTSIGGSWLTEKGKAIYEEIK